MSKWGEVQDQLDSSASHALLTTGSDISNLTEPCRAILVGTAGNVRVTMLGGEDVILPLIAGYNPIRASKIWASSMTALNVVALW